MEAGIDALRRAGIEAVAVEPLAKELGVTKGSFYWHFSGRDELQEAILDMWELEGTSRIIDVVEREDAGPDARLRRLVEITLRPTAYDELEGALRAWARSSQLAAAAVKRVDGRRLRYVTRLLQELGIERGVARLRAEIFYRTLIGELTYRAAGGQRLRLSVAEEILRFMLASGPHAPRSNG